MTEVGTSATPDYAERLRAEIEHFRAMENVHDLPKIFNVWAQKYVSPKVRQVLGTAISHVEEFYAHYICRYAAENPAEELRIASIGAGNGDFEVRVARLLKNSGLDRFRFQCLDINPAMLDRGRDAAFKEQMTERFEFLEVDGAQWLPAQPLDIVMAHHSLHHIQQLENTFANVKEAVRERGYFITCDMIGRNGHMRWPEALEIVHNIWQTMPDRYKYNHQLKRFEALYENWDCSTEGFEGIRAQDILPLLIRFFKFEAFVAFGNLPDIFVDRSFGHNLNPENEQDVAFIDRLGELNDRLISEGKIKPTQMMAVMRTSDVGPCKSYLHWTPEFCVRPPLQSDTRAAAVIPLTGCGMQVRPAAGFWRDGWISSSFAVTILVKQHLDSIVIDGCLPEQTDHEPELYVWINGLMSLQEKVRPGLFSLRVHCEIGEGELLQLRITSHKLYRFPHHESVDDDRELAFALRKIHFIASSLG